MIFLYLCNLFIFSQFLYCLINATSTTLIIPVQKQVSLNDTNEKLVSSWRLLYFAPVIVHHSQLEKTCKLHF